MSEDDDFPRWLKNRRFPLGFPLGGLSKEFDSFIAEFDKMFRDMFKDIERNVPRELVRERVDPEGNKKRQLGPFVYGYSVTLGPDGEPTVREFGNIKPGEEGNSRMEVSEQREPLTDILEDQESVKVVAEVPGVEKSDINVSATETSLEISVTTPRKYLKTLELPAKIVPETAKASYKNGILEVSLRKEKAHRPAGKTIQIE